MAGRLAEYLECLVESITGAKLNRPYLMSFGLFLVLVVPHDIADLIHEIREGGDAGEMEIHEPTYNICERMERGTYTRTRQRSIQLRRVRASQWHNVSNGEESCSFRW